MVINILQGFFPKKNNLQFYNSYYAAKIWEIMKFLVFLSTYILAASEIVRTQQKLMHILYRIVQTIWN